MNQYITFILGLGIWIAYILIFLTVFAECGLLIGFFLPGDSLLITVGLVAGQGHFNIILLCVLVTIASIIGSNVGYAFGKKVGPAIFNRPKSRFFSKERLEQAHLFYEKHGVQTVVLARFVPFARTFAPVLAGVSEMEYHTFFLYNIVGGIGWASGVTLLGYFLGKYIPNVDQYVLLIVAIILVLSIVPGVIKLLKKKVPKV